MAIIGKLMGSRPGMSAPKPAPVSSRPSLDFLTGGQPKQTIPADAFDRDALIQDILSKIQVPSAPAFDPSGLQARLAELEGRKAPVFDPSALQEQIAELQNREAPVFDPSELQKQISDLRQRPSRDDFMSIERQLQDLRNRDIPQFDPSALQEQIGGLQQQLGNIPQFDDSALRDRLQALEGREIPQFDASGLQSQIGGLQDRLANIPQFDPSQLQAGIAGLQDRLANIPQFDPSALQQQIEANRNLLGNIPQFDDSALRERLKSLEGREIPQFDPSQLQAGIQGLSERISNLPQFDPSALQNRLAELEGRQAPTFNPEDFREQFLNIAREGIDIPQPSAPDLSGFARLEDLPTFDRDALIRDIRSGIDIPQAPQIDREALIKDITGRIQVPKPPSIDRESIIRDIQDRIKLPTPGRPFDPSRLQERLAKLESRETPRFDPTKLRERLAALENREPAPVAPAFDPSGLQARLQALESRKPVAPPPAFDPSRLQARLDALEGREPVAAPPAFDPSTLQERLAALENRQPISPPAFDTSSIDQRFEDIARQLAELQSAQAQPSTDPVVPPVQPLPVEPVAPPETPLPIQPPGDLDLGIKQDRPDPRDFAKPLPGGGTIYDELPLKRPLPGGDFQVISGGQRLLPSPFANSSPEEIARRKEQQSLSGQISSATKDFFAAFPDAPKAPRMMTADMQSYTDPITGEFTQGSGSMARYRSKLKAYLDANPAAQASYNENVLTPQKRLIDLRGGPKQGPVLTPIGVPTIKPGVGQFSTYGPGYGIVQRPSPAGEFFGPDGKLVDSGRPQPPISIGGPGGGVGNMLAISPGGPIPVSGGGREDLVFPGGSPTFNERGETFVPPPQPPRVPLSERTDIFGAGKRYDPANLPEGFSFDAPSDGIYNMAMPPPGFVYAYGPDGERQAVPSGEPGAAEMRDRPSFSFGPGGLTPPPPSTPTGPSEIPVADIAPDPVTTPAPVTPPASTTVAANQPPAAPPPAPTIPTPPGSVDPIIMGQTADEVVTDPLIRALYFGTPDQPGFFNQLQQVGANLLGAQAPGTEYDPSMTEKFFNPFEDQVVQQTVEDVLKAGAQRDIAQRAQDVGRGGLSAFGSRARLTADERQEALGRGLGKALAGIRQSGFSEAQRAGLSEFDRQYGRDISQLYRPLDVLRGIGGLLPGYQAAGTNLRTTYGMPQDPSALGLGAALSAYSSFAPQTGAAYNAYANTAGQG